MNWKTISNSFLFKAIIEFIFISIAVFWVQSYFQRKWAPLTAAETLKRENYIASKKQTYFDAIDIANREFSSINIEYKTSPNFTRIRGTSLPTEFEINSCLSRLYLFTDRKDIITAFKKMCQFRSGEVIATYIGLQIQMLKGIKADLAGEGDSTLINTYEYIIVNSDTTSR